MQQVVVLHGGNAFETYDEYIQSLQEKELTLERLKQSDWKKHLQENLGDAYDVYTPKLPNAQNALYNEWKIIFEKILALMNDDVILIGHSLGGLFLVKYLSENDVAKKIKATMLVAAPYSTATVEPIVDFTIDEHFEKLRTQGGKIFLYHSKNDKVVAFEHVIKYHAALPDATLKAFEDRGHFNNESFPELIADIKSLYL